MVKLEPSKIGVYSINGINIFEREIEEFIFNFEKAENPFRFMILNVYTGKTPLMLESISPDTKAVICFSLCARILVAISKSEIGNDLFRTPAECLLGRYFPEYLDQKYLSNTSLTSEQISLINQKIERFKEALEERGFAKQENSKNDSPLSASLDRIIGGVVDRFAHPDNLLNLSLKTFIFLLCFTIN